MSGKKNKQRRKENNQRHLQSTPAKTLRVSSQVNTHTLSSDTIAEMKRVARQYEDEFLSTYGFYSGMYITDGLTASLSNGALTISSGEKSKYILSEINIQQNIMSLFEVIIISRHPKFLPQPPRSSTNNQPNAISIPLGTTDDFAADIIRIDDHNYLFLLYRLNST
jgi:hypothetical protein